MQSILLDKKIMYIFFVLSNLIFLEFFTKRWIRKSPSFSTGIDPCFLAYFSMNSSSFSATSFNSSSFRSFRCGFIRNTPPHS